MKISLKNFVNFISWHLSHIDESVIFTLGHGGHICENEEKKFLDRP